MTHIFLVYVSLGIGRNYLVTPGKTTPDILMKEYGLDGVLHCNGEMMDLDVPMLELGTDAKQAKFKVECEQSRCVSIECCSYSLNSVRVFLSDGSPTISMSYSVPWHEFLLQENLGHGVLTNCHGYRIADQDKLTINDAPYLFAPRWHRGFASLGTVLAPMIPSIRLWTKTSQLLIIARLLFTSSPRAYEHRDVLSAR